MTVAPKLNKVKRINRLRLVVEAVNSFYYDYLCKSEMLLGIEQHLPSNEHEHHLPSREGKKNPRSRLREATATVWFSPGVINTIVIIAYFPLIVNTD